LRAFKIISWKLFSTKSYLKIKFKQMKIYLKASILLAIFCTIAKAEQIGTNDPMILHPEWYIKITDWSFYVASWVAIIHHVTIENTSDIAYKNIKVRVSYYSSSPSNYGTEIAHETGILPVTLPPHSKKTYLKGGTVLGAGSTIWYAGNLQVLEAVPIMD
jgi:hypothetical protein